MNKTTKEKIKIMLAHVNGEEIEYQDFSLIENFPWITTMSPSWNWGTMNYRIKPKKIKLYKWAIKDIYGNWCDTERFYKDEKHLKSVYDHKDTKFKRLDYTMIEVDED